MGRHYRIPKKNVRLFLLAISVAGDGRMRTLFRQQIEEWLEADQIDGETRSVGRKLVEALHGDSL